MLCLVYESASHIQHTPDVAGARVLLVTSGVARLDPGHLQAFRDAGFELRERYDLSGTSDEPRLIPELQGVWGVLAGTERYTRRVLTGARGLRAIARCGVGYDAVDIEAAHELGVHVLVTPGTNDDAVAEFTIALIAAACGLAQGESTIGDHTVAVVGLGAIGMGVARRLLSCGARVLGVDPRAHTDRCAETDIEVCDFESAVARASVITLHTPLNAHTAGMIGRREVALMQPDVILVNTARGGIIEEDALVHALRSDRIGAAALDVFTVEPLPSEAPWFDCPRVILTGHIAGITESSVRAMLQSALDGLVDVAAGRDTPRGQILASDNAQAAV